VAPAPLALLGPWPPAVDLGVQPNKIIYPMLGWLSVVIIHAFDLPPIRRWGWRDVCGALIAFTGYLCRVPMPSGSKNHATKRITRLPGQAMGD